MDAPKRSRPMMVTSLCFHKLLRFNVACVLSLLASRMLSFNFDHPPIAAGGAVVCFGNGRFRQCILMAANKSMVSGLTASCLGHLSSPGWMLCFDDKRPLPSMRFTLPPNGRFAGANFCANTINDRSQMDSGARVLPTSCSKAPPSANRAGYVLPIVKYARTW